MEPIYSEQLIVGIINNKEFCWYILDKEWCFMDSHKLTIAFMECGYEVPEDPTFRFGIEILNSDTKLKFLENITSYKVKTEVLRNQLSNKKVDRLAYNYSILINFDECLFVSYYSEMEEFENYIPEGWKGLYMDFSEFVPFKYRYWLDKDNKNMILE